MNNLEKLQEERTRLTNSLKKVEEDIKKEAPLLKKKEKKYLGKAFTGGFGLYYLITKVTERDLMEGVHLTPSQASTHNNINADWLKKEVTLREFNELFNKAIKKISERIPKPH